MNKEEFKKLVQALNDAEITQTDDEIIYDLQECKFKDLFQDIKIVDSNLDIDKHRWYEVSTDVIEIYGFYLGVMHVCTIYQENTDLEDIDFQLYFVEMEKVLEPTYVVKNDLKTIQIWMMNL